MIPEGLLFEEFLLEQMLVTEKDLKHITIWWLQVVCMYVCTTEANLIVSTVSPAWSS